MLALCANGFLWFLYLFFLFQSKQPFVEKTCISVDRSVFVYRVQLNCERLVRTFIFILKEYIMPKCAMHFKFAILTRA
jgi:hypothetical protein